MTSLYVQITHNYQGMCGNLIVKSFTRNKPTSPYSSHVEIKKGMFKKWARENNDNLGASYVEVGFIDDTLSEDVFNALSDLFPIVFISEMRKNKNSKNNVYFAVFDIKASDTTDTSKGE